MTRTFASRLSFQKSFIVVRVASTRLLAHVLHGVGAYLGRLGAPELPVDSVGREHSENPRRSLDEARLLESRPAHGRQRPLALLAYDAPSQSVTRRHRCSPPAVLSRVRESRPRDLSDAARDSGRCPRDEERLWNRARRGVASPRGPTRRAGPIARASARPDRRSARRREWLRAAEVVFCRARAEARGSGHTSGAERFASLLLAGETQRRTSTRLQEQSRAVATPRSLAGEEE